METTQNEWSHALSLTLSHALSLSLPLPLFPLRMVGLKFEHTSLRRIRQMGIKEQFPNIYAHNLLQGAGTICTTENNNGKRQNDSVNASVMSTLHMNDESIRQTLHREQMKLRQRNFNTEKVYSTRICICMSYVVLVFRINERISLTKNQSLQYSSATFISNRKQ